MIGQIGRAMARATLVVALGLAAALAGCGGGSSGGSGDDDAGTDGGTGGGGEAPGAVIVSDVECSDPVVFESMTCTVTGENLTSALSLVAPGCESITEKDGGSATTRSYECVPIESGSLLVQVVSGGQTYAEVDVDVLLAPTGLTIACPSSVAATSTLRCELSAELFAVDPDYAWSIDAPGCEVDEGATRYDDAFYCIAQSVGKLKVTLARGGVVVSSDTVTVTAEPKVASVFSTDDNAWAVKEDGSLWVWGPWCCDNRHLNEPLEVLNDVKAAAGTEGRVIAIRSDGSLWVVGGDVTSTSLLPRQLSSEGQKFAAVSVSSGNHALAVGEDGSLYAWGQNGEGQVGDGDFALVELPKKTADGFVKVVAQDTFSLGLKSDGTVWGWGTNYHKQLGDGSTTNRAVPTAALLGNGFVDIAAGATNGYAVRDDGTLWAWGWNSGGSLGAGITETPGFSSLYDPVMIGTGYASVCAGSYHAMAIKTNGSLWVWGADNSGSLGLGPSVTEITAPTLLGTGYVRCDGGTFHSVAVKADKSVWVWGDNSRRQLGFGDETSRNVPTKLVLH